MGLFDQLFPYASERERIEAEKDADNLPASKKAGLLNSMKMDTGKYMDKRSAQQKEADAIAAQRAAQINRVNNAGGIASFTTDQAVAPYSPPMNDPAQLEKQQTEQKPYPSNIDNWDFWQKMDILTSQRAADAYDKTKLPYGGDVRGDDAYKNYVTDQQKQTNAQPKEFLPEDPQATAPPVDPQQQMIADIQRQRAMLDAIYPQRQTANPDQATADEYGLQARERAAKQAQLALFAGITKGAGGSWVGVGEGLAAAGNAYDTGYQRYQAALQDKATRAKGANDTAYSDDAARTNAAVNLYSDEKKLDIARMKEAGDQRKEDRKELMKRFELTKPKESDFPDPDNAKRMEDWNRRLQMSLERGQYIAGSDDVR